MNNDENEYRINLTGDPLTSFLLKKLDYFKLFVSMFIIVIVVPVILGLQYNTVFGAPPEIEKNYTVLFSWDEIPGKDNWRLLDFLDKKYHFEWLKTAKIEKIDNNRTIMFSGERSISLTLNDEKTKVNLKIDDVRTYEFIAKIESNKINIYTTPFMPLIKDYLGQIITILTIAVSLLAKNLFDKVKNVFSSLPKNLILKLEDTTDYKKFLETFQKDINNKHLFLVCLLIVPNVAFTPFVLSPSFRNIPTAGTWFDKDLFTFSWAYWFLLLYFLWFGLSLLAWKTYVIVKYIRLLGKFDFNVQILHPDRCGGFKSIGDLCLNIDMIIFAVGVAAASIVYFIRLEDQPQLLFSLIFYICASFFFFFYPIMDIHNAMQNSKTEIMSKINTKLENHPNLYERTIDKDGNVDKEALKKIQDIREINREVSKIPVWPFDSETLWKFVSTTSIPAIAIILKIIGV